MLIKQFEIWLVALNPQIGTETGKTRPLLIIQTKLLNSVSHQSTIIYPIITNSENGSDILRTHLKRGMTNLYNDSDVMIDQMRAIDNDRLIKKIGSLPSSLIEKVKGSIMITLDLE